MNYIIPCGKCGGRGVREEYAHIDNGVCFECDGSGKVKTNKKQYAAYKSNTLAIGTLANEEQKKVVKIAVLRKQMFIIYDENGIALTGHFDEPVKTYVRGNDVTGFYITLKGIKRFVEPAFDSDNRIEKWNVRPTNESADLETKLTSDGKGECKNENS